MKYSRKNRAQEVEASIREILRRDWNPIGFDDMLPEDEYDGYIGQVYRILSGSRSERDLVDYLFRMERDAMGLSTESSDHLKPVVGRLLELDVRLSEDRIAKAIKYQIAQILILVFLLSNFQLLTATGF